MDLKQAVVFCILMENNKGILYKSPDYVSEKMHAVRRNNPECLLDQENLKKLKEYNEKWNCLWHIEE